MSAIQDLKLGLPIRNRRLVFAVLLLLLSWGLRLCWLEEVPPGWRDDELINIHALSGQLLNGQFPLYYLGASGHEPLYHHLHAGVHAVLGFNVLSAHMLSVMFGTLSIALTYSLVRRLFPEKRATAALVSLTLAVSFWSLMYSRTAIRHISLPPFVLATIYAFWRQIDAAEPTLWGWSLIGLLLGLTLYTYTASRLLPVLLILFAGYLALFRRDRFQSHWRGLTVALTVMALLAAPLGIAIAQGRSERAIEGIGADARVTELATPVRALQSGDPRPLLASMVKTLGMFHASGDPEWLYNIAGRPVFDLLGGVLLWSGVALSLHRWRQPRHFLLLAWLVLGLSPAFISTPPASLSHTILAQPVAYIFPALALVEFCGWLRLRGAQPFVCGFLVVAFVSTNAMRDLRDYFITWPERGMVRVLYRAEMREVADYLNTHPEIDHVAVGSALMGPWDRIALEVDIERDDVAPRLFNPERALVWPAGGESSRPAAALLPSWPEPGATVAGLLTQQSEEVSRPGSGVALAEAPHLSLYMLPPISQALTTPQSEIPLTRFANGLVLRGAQWLDPGDLAPGREAILLTAWHVAAPLDLPPMPIVAHPPPPETYSGPRLAMFAHLSDADGRMIASDDGVWVDPLTLQPDDRFVQVHRFTVPDSAADGPYALELGLYDPKTDERCPVLRRAQGRHSSDDPTDRLGDVSRRENVLSFADVKRHGVTAGHSDPLPAPAGSVSRRQHRRCAHPGQSARVRRSHGDT
jgi:4-amino-4-deoxy-L-arabinose transferase-like glycosyltransferase